MRRLIGQLHDPLVDLADERLVVCSLLGMGVVHRHVGSFGCEASASPKKRL